MEKGKLKYFICALLGIVLPLSPAYSLVLKPQPRVCAEYFKSETVFTGKVISVKAVKDTEGFVAGHWYRIKVYKVYRGQDKKVITLYINNDSGRFLIDVGKDYLIFAHRYDKYLTVYCCGNSVLLSAAKQKILEIESIPTKTDGEVEGLVGPEPGLQGVAVRIVGKDTSYSVVTDSVGWFHIHVKPGTYKAEVGPQRINSRNYEFQFYDLSYDDPNSFYVPRGGCAEIAFRPTQKK